MDKSVFRSFEYYWDEEVLKYWSIHEDRKITKQRFGVIFSKVWDKAATPANIKAGFEATGIYLFNPENISPEAYAPSIPTFNPVTPGPSAANYDNENNDSDVTDADKENIDETVSDANESLSGVLPDLDCNNDDISNNDLLNVQQHQPVLNENSGNHSSIQPSENNTPCKKSPFTYDKNSVSTPNSVQTKSASSESDDDVPLAQLRQSKQSKRSVPPQLSSVNSNDPKQSLDEILKTPEKFSSPTTTPRRKAINCLAQELTKSIFTSKENKPGPSKIAPSQKNKTKQSYTNTVKKRGNKEPRSFKKDLPKRYKGKSDKTRAESWFCFVCGEDRVADMRPCTICATYVHEECVGLTAEDTDNFVCTKCDN